MSLQSTIPAKTIIAPASGLVIQNNLVPCYGKAIGNNSGSIIISNGGATVILPGLSSGSSGVTYNKSTGGFTILTSGTYEISCMLTFTTAITGYVTPLINGTTIDATEGRIAQTGGSGNAPAGNLTGTNLINLVAGQVLTLSLTTGTGNTVNLQNNAQDTWWWLRKVA
jgi:hypothetical protein